MMIRRLGTIAATTAIVWGTAWTVGCDKPGVTEQQKENAAVQDNAAAQNHAAQEAASSQSQMNDKVAAARADFTRVRDDYRRDRDHDLDDIDQKIASADAHARGSSAATRDRLEQSLTAIRGQRDALAADLRGLDSVAVSAWDDTKSRIDNEFNALKDSVDKLS